MELSLNIIVGKGEQDILERCLKSVGDLCEEIVVTCTTDDPAVLAVANKYATIVGHFTWCDDFSAARNYSFSLSTKPYIMWLDSDDVIKPEELKKIRELKPQLERFTCWLLDYAYTHGDRDERLLTLPRERIVKNGLFKWEGVIHECMNVAEVGQSVRIPIVIDHYRTKSWDPNRNIRIMAQEYDAGRANPRMKFYYGKELIESGGHVLGREILEKYLAENADWEDNQAIACYHLGKYYNANGLYEEALKYGRMGISKNPGYAENHFNCGIACRATGDIVQAEKYYLSALTQVWGGTGMSQYRFYYNVAPRSELATLCFDTGRYQDSLYHVDEALKEEPHDKPLLRIRRLLEKVLIRESKMAVIQVADMKQLTKAAKALGLDIQLRVNRLKESVITVTKQHKISVAWMIPIVSQVDPATRIRRLNVSQKLNEMGIESKIVSDYAGKDFEWTINSIGLANCIVLTQYGLSELHLAKRLRLDGHCVVLDVCEAIFGAEYEHEIMAEVDAIICASSKLAEMLKKWHPNVIVIRDAIEDRVPTKLPDYGHRDKPVAMFCGCGGNSWLAKEWLKPTIEKAGYELKLVTEWDDAEKWSLDNWPDQMCQADVILCPQRVDLQPAKSNVKVTQAMAFGIPVIASPIQSYMECIRHGSNGYLAKTEEDWYSALLQLRSDINRKKIGEAGKSSIGPYTLESITKLWMSTLDKLLNGVLQFPRLAQVPHPQPAETVDIIIPVYNGLEYLKLCLNSILMNTNEIGFRIIISDSGSDEETWKYLSTLKGIVVIGDPSKRLSFSEACNAGILRSNTAKFVIMNSDVIVSKGWLAEMMNATKIERCACVGVLSNCDRGWLHGCQGRPTYPMRVGDLELVPGMKLEQITPVLPQLHQFMEDSNRNLHGQVIQQSWLAEYCVLHVRCAIDEVGYFDTQYQNGCEDLDLMTRLERSHYKFAQALGAFVFHFGGVSRGAYQSINREVYDKQDVENHQMYKAKWAHKKIMIYTGPAWEQWGPDQVEQGMAGSETWACYLAREFAKRDYQVVVYGDPDGIIKDGELITYKPHTDLKQDIEYDLYDLAIISRTVEPCRLNLHALRKWVMIHDIWLHPQQNYDVLPYRVDGYAVLSPWHKEFVKNHHKIPDEKLWITANGLSPEDAWEFQAPIKNDSAVYSSSPDRGLLQLLDMLPEIRAVVPDFELHVCYGFYNWEEACRKSNDQDGLRLIKLLEERMKNTEGVIDHGRVSKKDLANLQLRAKVWLMPEWFSETFCISAIENAAAGNALITTDYAGLQITAAGGILLPLEPGMGRDQPLPAGYRSRFLEETIKCLTDAGYRSTVALRSLEATNQFRWGKIADGWISRTGLDT